MKHSLPILLVLALASCTATGARAQGPREGSNWFSLGLQTVQPEPDSFFDLTEELGLAVEGGHVLQADREKTISWEGLLHYSVHDAEVNGITTAEEPTNLKIGTGGRVSWTLERGLSPYIRGGLVFQHVYDDALDDSGLGLYLGAGLDVPIGDGMSIGPSVFYSKASLSDFDQDDLALGVRVNFSL